MDGLPVGFGAKRVYDEGSGRIRRDVLNSSLRDFLHIIREESGYRFWHRKTTSSQGYHQCQYFCSQDVAQKRSHASGKRDLRVKDSFKCNSNLRITLSFATRTIRVNLHHLPHNLYKDLKLSLSIQDFIDDHVTSQLPAEIYRDVLALKISGYDTVTPGQIYYRWQQKNASSWRLHDDPLVSSSLLLDKHKHEYEYHRICEEGSMTGLAFFPRNIMSMVGKVQELAMDATFGTNNTGMGLYAVLAEVDGAGYPVAYCFVHSQPKGTTDNTMVLSSPTPSGVPIPPSVKSPRSEPGALTCLLTAFLTKLRHMGFEPGFVGCDKDFAEINAIRMVWPRATVQLCYWHAKRAIRARLRDNRQSSTQNHYYPDDAKKIVPELEICWGSLPHRRLLGEHRDNTCQCDSRSEEAISRGSIETVTAADRDTVLSMFDRHCNAHPFIPDKNGTLRTSEVIHQESASEMYRWCRIRGYYRLWAYLYVNWYKAEQFEMWARSANGSQIAVLKTTMIVESHWRKIKHDHLHRFNRPRIDMVIWVMIARILPDIARRLQAIQDGNFRIASSSWRKGFKANWKFLSQKDVNRESLKKYYTDPASGTCACDSFLLSRFLICKHLVHCFEDIVDMARFADTVSRSRSLPFWRNPQLQLRDDFPEQQAGHEDLSESETESQDDLNSTDYLVNGNESIVETQNESDDNFNAEDFLRRHRALGELFEEQWKLGNRKFCKLLSKGNVENDKLLRELSQLKNARHMPTTWGKRKHAATMYYRHVSH